MLSSLGVLYHEQDHGGGLFIGILVCWFIQGDSQISTMVRPFQDCGLHFLPCWSRKLICMCNVFSWHQVTCYVMVCQTPGYGRYTLLRTVICKILYSFLYMVCGWNHLGSVHSGGLESSFSFFVVDSITLWQFPAKSESGWEFCSLKWILDFVGRHYGYFHHFVFLDVVTSG